MKILVIEDEDLIFQILKSFFERYGYQCEYLNPKNLQDILEHPKDDYDVILCDYMMPNVTGMDVYNALNSELREKFIIMTGGFIDNEKQNILRSSNVKIVNKPFDIMELHMLIREKTKMGE